MGDTTGLGSMAASAYLTFVLRQLLAPGNAAYFFKVSTGETIILPVYDTLVARGVEFEFFHKITRVVPAADGSRVEAIVYEQQTRTIDGSPYRPLRRLKDGQRVWPNKPGILPDWAELTVDFRHPDKDQTLAMEAKMQAAIPRIAERANVEIEVKGTWGFGDEVFDVDCLNLIRDTARDLSVPFQEMLSQAGHDAYHMTRVAPTALLFSPCKEGITHNENEHIELEYTLPSVNVLLHAVLRRASA